MQDNVGIDGRAVLDATGQAVVVTDLDRRIIYGNAAAEERFGWNVSEVIGRLLSEVIAPGLPAEVDAQIVTTIRRKEVWSGQVTLHRRDGTTFDAQVILTPLIEGDGRVTGVVGVSSELTELQAARAQADKRAVQQAAVADLARQALEEGELDRLFEDTVTAVAGHLGAPLCKVLELTPDQQQLRLRAGVGWAAGLVGQATVPVDHGSQAGYTLLQTGPVVVADFAAEGRFTRPELLATHQVSAGMSTVIPGLDENFGVLGVHLREPRAFDEDDVAFLESAARVLGGAVARLELEETARLWRTVVEHLPAGLHIWDGSADPDDPSSYRLVAMNPAAQAMDVRPAPEARGRTARELGVTAPGLGVLGDAVRTTMQQHQVVEPPLLQVPELLGPDRWLNLRTFPLPMDNLIGVTFVDVTDQQRLEAERVDLLERSLHVADDERRRLAEHLHDEPIQLLAAMDFRLQTLGQRVDDPELGTLRGLVGQASNALRRFVLEFHPPALTPSTLAPTVDAYAQRLLAPAGVELALAIDLPDDLAPARVTATYRLLVESLSNVARHAHATHVSAQVHTGPDSVNGRVLDNGRGIPDDAQTGPGHLGLRAMHDHAALVGGHVTVSRADPHGTLVDFAMPLTQTRESQAPAASRNTSIRSSGPTLRT